MSYVPQELRNQATRKLEDAIRDRDRQLDGVRRDANQLQRMLGQLDGQLQQQAVLSRQLEGEITAAEQELQREQQQALERLWELRAAMEEQHGRLQAALQEAEARHRREWNRLQEEIHQLAHQREEKERRLHTVAVAATKRSAEILAAIDPDDTESLDLAGQAASASQRLTAARALLADPETLGAEKMGAALGAQEGALDLRGLLARREALLRSYREDFEGTAELLDRLATGEAEGELLDQRGTVDDLLKVERSEMAAMIDRHLRRSAQALNRWNGHAALCARLTQVRELLMSEIYQARRCLTAAAAHEVDRYVLDHVWDQLEVRFGKIRDQDDTTEGTWVDPADHKSTYLYFLSSRGGEIRVAVPWLGPLQVYYEGRQDRQLPSFSEHQGQPEVLWIGNLVQRWRRLAGQLDNPNWDPDQHSDEEVS